MLERSRTEIAVESADNTGTRSKQEIAYQRIKERIVNGTYSAGYRLVIDRIATELGCSAIPVREAARRLEAEGLVVYERNAGVRVSNIDSTSYVETLSVLAVLEGYATALAANKLTAADFLQLREFNTRMQQAREAFDLESYSKFNQAFHRLICQASGQAYLLDEMDSAQRRIDSVRRVVFMLIPHRTTDSLAEHRHLLALLEGKAPFAEIEAAARSHKLATVQAFEEWNRLRTTNSLNPGLAAD